jgi:hypothetical protein
MSKKSVTLSLAMSLAAGCWLFSACGNNTGCVSSSTGQSFGGFGGCVTGGTASPQTSFQILGDEGTPFTATIADTQASFVINGTVPLSVVLVNSHPPIQLSATKNDNDSALLSLELVFGSTVQQLASTSAPFGTVFVQTGTLTASGPSANPDVRFLVKAPLGETFQSLIEDPSNGFIISATVPALLLFEGSQGKVDGQFIQTENFGPFAIDLIINGTVVAQASGAPNISIRQP